MSKLDSALSRYENIFQVEMLIAACLTLLLVFLLYMLSVIGVVIAALGVASAIFFGVRSLTGARKLARETTNEAAREARINRVADRYVSSYRGLPKDNRNPNNMPQLLLDSGALETRNNSELEAVRQTIHNHNLSDPCSVSPFLQQVDLHKFFRFVRQHNLRLDGAGQLMAAIGRFQGIFEN